MQTLESITCGGIPYLEAAEKQIINPLERNISYFGTPIMNTTPYQVVSLQETAKFIIEEPYLKKATQIYRDLPDEKKDRFKKYKFPYVLFQGIFTKRQNDALIRPSNLIVLDIDKLGGAEGMKKQIAQNPILSKIVVMAFVSPSNYGLKVIIKNPFGLRYHEQLYNEVGRFLLDTTLNSTELLDTSCVDVSRACFLCSDKNIFINF